MAYKDDLDDVLELQEDQEVVSQHWIENKAAADRENMAFEREGEEWKAGFQESNWKVCIVICNSNSVALPWVHWTAPNTQRR